MCVCRKGEREEKEGNLSEIYSRIASVCVERDGECVEKETE